MTINEKITKFWKKNDVRITALGVGAAFTGIVAISESQKIGSYRPEGLNDAYTSYVAYDKGDAIWLFPPVIPGFGHGPIIDEGKDGTINYVGTLTYPRMPFSFNQLELGSLDQRQQRRESWQEKYDEAMAEIRR